MRVLYGQGCDLEAFLVPLWPDLDAGSLWPGV